MPAPPYCSGKITPRKPISASLGMISEGNVEASSHSITCGAISPSANSRTVRRRCCCSSVSEKSTIRLYHGRAGAEGDGATDEHRSTLITEVETEANGRRTGKHFRRASAAADRAPTKLVADGTRTAKHLRQARYVVRLRAQMVGKLPRMCAGRSMLRPYQTGSGSETCKRALAQITTRGWRRRSGGLRRGGLGRRGRGSGAANR